jgi:hypothetical protein
MISFSYDRQFANCPPSAPKIGPISPHPRPDIAAPGQRFGARPHRDAGAGVAVVQRDLRLGYLRPHRRQELLGLRHRPHLRPE